VALEEYPPWGSKTSKRNRVNHPSLINIMMNTTTDADCYDYDLYYYGLPLIIISGFWTNKKEDRSPS
jgi:hypothetical protein